MARRAAPCSSSPSGGVGSTCDDFCDRGGNRLVQVNSKGVLTTSLLYVGFAPTVCEALRLTELLL